MSGTFPTSNAGADRLASLAVVPTALSDQRRAELDRDGYTIIPGVIDDAWLQRMRASFDAIIAGAEHADQDHIMDLVNRDAVFDGCWTHALVLAAALHVLGRPFKLSSLNCREPRQGQGLQGLHADWGDNDPQAGFQVANSLWLLDDVDEANGATRVIPGSHRWDTARLAALVDREAEHADQVVLRASAGSAVVFNAHLLHGGTRNHSGRRRRVIHAYYTGREHAPQVDQRRDIRLATWKRLTRDQRWLLDVEEDLETDPAA